MSIHLLERTNATAPSLEDLREEIDALDDALLQLIQERQTLAARAGSSKGGSSPGALALKPDREAHVLSRLLERAPRETHAVVLRVWRELMSAGLATQQRVEVVVWPGVRSDLAEMARARFGAACPYRQAETAAEALHAVADGHAVAVLALSRDEPWWARLSTRHPGLKIFEALGGRGPTDPAALAVGRVDPNSLTGPVAYLVSNGGDDAGTPRSMRRLLGMTAGTRLYAVTDADASGYGPELLGRAPVVAVGV